MAKGRLTIEIIEKTRKYEPRVEVVKVCFDTQLVEGLNGKLAGKVVLKFV